MLIDTHVFLGAWPFLHHPVRTAPALAAHLAAHGIGRALVSPFAAAFLPEPMPANRALFAAVRRTPALVPVPVINPALATWREHLDACLASSPVPVVRLMPAFHHYTLRDRRLDAFMAALAERGVKLAITVRLDDERNRYHSLAVKGVPAADLALFLRRHAAHHVLCNGLYKAEIEHLARECGNFSADLTFAEFLDTLAALRAALPARRLMLGTATPLFSTAAQLAKLHATRQPARERAAVGAGNARRFFGL